MLLCMLHAGNALVPCVVCDSVNNQDFLVPAVVEPPALEDVLQSVLAQAQPQQDMQLCAAPYSQPPFTQALPAGTPMQHAQHAQHQLPMAFVGGESLPPIDDHLAAYARQGLLHYLQSAQNAHQANQQPSASQGTPQVQAFTPGSAAMHHPTAAALQPHETHPHPAAQRAQQAQQRGVSAAPAQQAQPHHASHPRPAIPPPATSAPGSSVLPAMAPNQGSPSTKVDAGEEETSDEDDSDSEETEGSGPPTPARKGFGEHDEHEWEAYIADKEDLVRNLLQVRGPILIFYSTQYNVQCNTHPV